MAIKHRSIFFKDHVMTLLKRTSITKKNQYPELCVSIPFQLFFLEQF